MYIVEFNTYKTILKFVYILISLMVSLNDQHILSEVTQQFELFTFFWCILFQSFYLYTFIWFFTNQLLLSTHRLPRPCPFEG